MADAGCKEWYIGSQEGVLAAACKARLSKKFQEVRYNGVLYVVTRMAFGLNFASKSLSKILARVLALDELINCRPYHYINDIMVNESRLYHLLKYRLSEA